MDLAAECASLERRLPRAAAATLRSQLQRAALSIPANIAEGAGRRSRADYLRHLGIANGSLLELETHLLLVARLGYSRAEQVEPALGMAAEVGRMLGGLIRSLGGARKSPAPGAPLPPRHHRD